ncbi:MAG: hypothetical protein QG632_509 [Candidatus Dependentiae bacterium]|nr:hypothetical protein [Candidatus Dependentiae bacterium]
MRKNSLLLSITFFSLALGVGMPCMAADTPAAGAPASSINRMITWGISSLTGFFGYPTAHNTPILQHPVTATQPQRAKSRITQAANEKEGKKRKRRSLGVTKATPGTLLATPAEAKVSAEAAPAATQVPQTPEPAVVIPTRTAETDTIPEPQPAPIIALDTEAATQAAPISAPTVAPTATPVPRTPEPAIVVPTRTAETDTIPEPQPAPIIALETEAAAQAAPISTPAVALAATSVPRTVELAAVVPRKTARRNLCPDVALLPQHLAAKAYDGIHSAYHLLKPACDWYASHRSYISPVPLIKRAYEAYRRWRPSAETIRSFDLRSGNDNTITDMHIKVAEARIQQREHIHTRGAAVRQLLFDQSDTAELAHPIAIDYASHTLRVMGIELTPAITAMLDQDSSARKTLAIIGLLNREGGKIFSPQAIAYSLQQRHVVQHPPLADQNHAICFEINQRIYSLQDNAVTAIGDWKHSMTLTGIKVLNANMSPAQRMTILYAATPEDLKKYTVVGWLTFLGNTEQAAAFAHKHYAELSTRTTQLLDEPAAGISTLELCERMHPHLEEISPATAALLITAERKMTAAKERIGRFTTAAKQFALTDVTYDSPVMSQISSLLPNNSAPTEEIPSQKVTPNNTCSLHQQLTSSAAGTKHTGVNAISTPEKSKINGFTLCGGALTLGGALALLQQLRHQLPLAGKLADQIRLTATEEDLSSPTGKSIYRAYGPRKAPIILSFLGMIAGVAMITYGARN